MLRKSQIFLIGLPDYPRLPFYTNPPNNRVEVYPWFLFFLSQYRFPKLYFASAKHPFNSMHLEIKLSQSKYKISWLSLLFHP